MSNYSYQGLKLNLTGRGSLGFRIVNSTDAQTNIAISTTYQQAFPFIGLPNGVQTTLAGSGNGGVLKSVTNTYGCNDFVDASGCTVAIGRRYFPYLTQSVASSWDLNGAAFPTVTSSATNFDNYGNAGQTTKSTSDGYTSTAVLTYNNDTTHWWLGQLIESQTTNTAP